MRILVVTDAWHPQVNGVVRTLGTLSEELTQLGHEAIFITPDQFRSVPCPTYPEIRLALRPGPRMARTIEANQPCAIHIATEGPLGWAARRYCLKRRLPFTTAYHTKFPEYIRARFRVPLQISYRLVRKFHAPASTIMVATQTIQAELEDRGFERIRRWSRGVNTEMFKPRSVEEIERLAPGLKDLPKPIHLYVGRVAVEKNIQSFLALDLPGTKLVVGDGPQLEELRRKYPDVVFAGSKIGEELAAHYSAASVFVFPQPHRYVRLGLARSPGVRCAGGRLSGSRPARRHRRFAGRRVVRGSRHGGAAGAGNPAGDLPHPCGDVLLAGLHPAIPRQSGPPSTPRAGSKRLSPASTPGRASVTRPGSW